MGVRGWGGGRLGVGVRGLGLGLGFGFGLTFGLIVDPLQPNTLLLTMALQRQLLLVTACVTAD